ncbi:hypothetical protein K438DRAFT_1902951 [Mycena galopus ATCC 62051]|nr:hypothetical protein K438DRAFT_1902951 [Mycena galopus ATCC 62051]
MPPRSSQKRAAGSEAEAEASTSRAKAPPPKKTRFVDPSEDPANFAEEVEANLEQTTRKGGDDGEGVVESRKKGAEDEDDDMFAKKKEEYLRLGDIEGQERRAGGRGRRGAPEEGGMGFEMSSFNMRDEMEEGKFTEDGTYVKSFDPHGVHDRWMEGLDEREIKLARRRKRQQERQQKERMRAEEKEIEDSALQRLGVQAKKSGQTKKAGKLKAGDAMNRMTHLASTIMSLGDTDIYSKTFEELVRAVRSSGIVDPEWVPPSNDKQYEYKWRAEGAGQPGEVFGPFSKENMAAWYKPLEVRETGGGWGDWDSVLE